MATGPRNQGIQQFRRELLTQDKAELTDGQLLECFVVQQDEAAFEALVRRHGPMVLGVCRRITGHAQDAEDAFQAAFLVLARKADSVRPRELVGNWLYGVACRTALKAQAVSARRRAKEKQVQTMPEPPVRLEADGNELLPLLDAALERLPRKYRVPVILCELEGRSRNDVAQQLGLPEGTLSSRLATARQLLAGRLSRQGLLVSAGALTAVFSQTTATAWVSSSLIHSTVKAATLAAAGQAVTTGVISARVAALTEGVLKTMLLTNLKTTTVFALVISAMIVIASSPTFVDLFAWPADAHKTAPVRAVVGGATARNGPVGGRPAAILLDDVDNIVGSGKPDTKKIDVADFTSLDVSSAFAVDVTKADKFSVSVTADDNLLEHIKVEKKDSTLRIRFVDGKSIHTKSSIGATITMPALKGVTLSGASRVTLKGFESNEDLAIKLTGASILDGTIKAKNLKAETDGASKLSLKGSATEATLTASGASQFQLADFAVESAKVHLAGASRAEVRAKSKLDYEVSGASHLNYLGNPTIGKKATTGASSATNKEPKKQ
jgi:RNA polymerase sigma factor (sigma-70 family)